jgi:hypothetical protein
VVFVEEDFTPSIL